jgi:hypothetical protein
MIILKQTELFERENYTRFVSLSNSAPHLSFRLYRPLTNVVQQTLILHRCAPHPTQSAPFQSIWSQQRRVVPSPQLYRPGVHHIHPAISELFHGN